ncbi:hypothetical protein VNO77_03603 [Canavalia gladiata]|uniref:Secreted protein n=1 Tax=Canavalia gladiata TaxID=3824 RepID=A0AAN9R8A6_CANGL
MSLAMFVCGLASYAQASHQGEPQSMILAVSFRTVEVHAFLVFPKRCREETEVRILTHEDAGHTSLFLCDLCAAEWYRIARLMRSNSVYQRLSCTLVKGFESSQDQIQAFYQKRNYIPNCAIKRMKPRATTRCSQK